MSEKERIDACLRIVSNRCRNLRKAIDRAKGLQQALTDGQTLRDEQLDVIKAIPKKEALLAELQEIMRKQTAVAEPKQEQTSKQSKHTAKTPKSVDESNGAHADSLEDHKSTDTPGSNSSDTPTQENDGIDLAALEEKYAVENKRLEEENARLANAMRDLTVEQNETLIREKGEVVQKILNLAHIADFLRDQGTRNVLLKFFQSADPSGASSLNELDMDLLCYFNMMLTSPNGNVAHNSAVDVSTAHCLEYLNVSQSDAFKGTSYARLTEIVETIATCPILTRRGETNGMGEARSAGNGTSEASGGIVEGE